MGRVPARAKPIEAMSPARGGAALSRCPWRACARRDADCEIASQEGSRWNHQYQLHDGDCDGDGDELNDSDVVDAHASTGVGGPLEAFEEAGSLETLSSGSVVSTYVKIPRCGPCCRPPTQDFENKACFMQMSTADRARRDRGG